MNKMKLVRIVAVASLTLAVAAPAAIIVDNGSLVYTQDFNVVALTRATAGENVLPWTNDVTVPGWYYTSSDNLISIGMGGTGNDIYSYGVQSTNIDRAIGWRIPSSTNGLAAVFTNATGATIQQLSVTYRGEQYRVVTNKGPDTLGFYYKIGGTFLGMGTTPPSNVWTEVIGLRWTTPKHSAYPTANLDGNAAGNYAVVSNSFSVTWNAGTELWLGFHANDATPNTLHGGGVDDIVVTFIIPEPGSTGLLAAGAMLAFARRWYRRRV